MHAEESLLKVLKTDLHKVLFKQMISVIFYVYHCYLQNSRKETNYMGTYLMTVQVIPPLYATLG